MAMDVSMSSDTVRSAIANAQASLLLKQGSAAAANRTSDSKEDAKIEKAGKDFESILLGSWLQKAEQSFATVPGGDQDDDEDPGKGQFQSMAMQSLAGSLTASGGIGIAKTIIDHLHTAAQPEHAVTGQKAQNEGVPGPTDQESEKSTTFRH